RRVTKDRVEFQESICNAGFIATLEGYVCVAKNQRFSHCHEMGIDEGRKPAGKPLTIDGERILYRIDFDGTWCLRSLQKLTVILDGRKLDGVVFMEDIRLVVCKDSILAFANGDGALSFAWPVLGVLKKDTLFLRSAVANFSAPQKNWMPFEYEKCLYLEYSIQPHLILKFDPDTAECTEA